MFKKTRTQKIILSVITSIFVFVELFSFVLFARPVQAFPVEVVTDLPKQVENIKSTIISTLTSVALGGLVKAMSSFMNKMARDTAMYIASGGKGQGSMIFQDGAADYFKKTALSASSGVIDDYSSALNKVVGVDKNKLSGIMVGLRNISSDPTKALLSGDLSSLTGALTPAVFDMANLEKIGGGKGGSSVAISSLSKYVSSGGSMGAVSQIKETVTKKVDNKTTGSQAERSGDTGVKPVSSLISGVIKTPASTIQEENKALTSKSQGDLNAQQVAGIYGNATLKTIPTALMTFLSTLTSQLMKKVMSGDWFDEAKKITSSGSEDSSNSFYSQFIISNKSQSLSSFNFLFKVPTRDVNEYKTLITELATCEGAIGINNCVIDENFMNVLNEALNDSPMTIGEMLASAEYGKVMDKPFISPSRKSQTESKDCAKDGYCYYNMQKLRRLRVVPLGFEIAALLANPDNPEDWTLSKVVSGFYECGVGPEGQAIRDANHPFCHLIDPNWILKLPSVKCEAEVYGATLAQDDGASGIRNTECIDFSTKVSEKAPNFYSYCTREKNVWRIDANTCDSQYSTCQTYTGSDNESASYLSRTLDYGKCDDTNVGCLAYSTEYDVENKTWQNSNVLNFDEKILGRSGTIYFNDKAANYTCDAEEEGCSKFILASSTVSSTSNEIIYSKTSDYKYLKKAPDYLGCYDLNTATDSPDINYPQTSVELASMTDKPAECANFSQVCIEDEVGCKNYSPVNDFSGSPDIPGVIGDNKCNASCVGYDTYRQLATEFAPTEFPLYFIPSGNYGGTTCTPEDVGCDEFTNIDELNKGGESLQYYTSLRRCELPTDNNQKTFYSWEGSSETGYVLKVHVLLPVDKDSADYISSLNFGTKDGEITREFAEGSPAYYNDYKEALETTYDLCNAEVYQDIIDGNDPLDTNSYDCRALYNKDGNIYYRLLYTPEVNGTVTVSDDCQPLRKTESLVEVDQYIESQARCDIKKGVWENDQCKRCYAGGSYEGGICYYWTIPSESKACSSAAANGCRAYRGNNGSNIQEIFFNNFEGDMDKWYGTNISIEAESLQVGYHSMSIVGNAIYSFDDGKLEDGQWYQLSFWARGNNQELTAKFQVDGNDLDNNSGNFTFDKINNSNKKISIGSEWKYYKLGPVQLDGVGNSMTLIVSANGNSKYYIDNIAVTKLEDQTYVIKDSWKKDYGDGILRDVPYVCDKNYDDAYPGGALGCKAYIDNTTPDLDNTEVYTTGFDKLCREGAVGCTAMYDTYNTDSSDIQIYNATCRVSYNDLVFSLNTCKATINNTEYSCELVNGEKSCVITGPINLPAGTDLNDGNIYGRSGDYSFQPVNYSVVISGSTIVIPADTPEDSPVFLTYTTDSICEKGDMGCQKVALEEKKIENGSNDVFDFPTEYYYLNDPVNYLGDTGILCSAETYGCSSFTKEGGGTEYFKDPKVLGNVKCSYIESVNNIDGNSGWFVDNVGRCGGSNTGELCTSNDHCDEGVTCDLDKKVPCYSDYKGTDNSYGLWSNDSAKYNGFVGQCPTEQSGCTELIDPQDKSQYYPNGQSYYVIFDKTLSDLEGECNGQVNLTKGCALFDRTDKPTKLYNSVATYDKSAQYNPVQKSMYNTVLPVTEVTDDGKLDANLILIVDRDRECSEWLYCKTSVDETDENGKTYEVCPDYGICNELDENGNCISPVYNFDYDGNLTTEKYISRQVYWESSDYVGYSLLDKKHIGSFSWSTQENNEFVLSNTNEDNNKIQATCKAYPEEDSPFDPLVAFKNIAERGVAGDSSNPTSSPFIRYYSVNTFSAFKNSNICQEGNCGCQYIKVQYQDSAATDYWPVTSESVIPPGVCSGTGEGVGKPCKTNDDCDSASQTCASISEKNSFYGTKGFCLEYDKSRPLSANSDTTGVYPCLTWLPFDIRVGNTDLYNSELATGYLPGLDTAKGNLGEVFCSESTQGYLYSGSNYFSVLVDHTFDITSSSIVNNNYDASKADVVGQTTSKCDWNTGLNCSAQWFYSNLQYMMWQKVGSTATVLFSRIPYHIFKGYEADPEDGDPGDSYTNVWNSWWDFYNTRDEQPLEGFINSTDNNNYNLLFGDRYNISIDDIRSFYLSPVLFKKKQIKPSADSQYDDHEFKANNDGFTLFEKLKIDVDNLKAAYEGRAEFSEKIKTENFDKYPDFSSSNFIYMYNEYGNSDTSNPARKYPLGETGAGGGGTMYTYSFYGENENDIRVGVVIDISDPKLYYKDANKNWDTRCLVDDDLPTDGQGKNSVYDIIKKAVNTIEPESISFDEDNINPDNKTTVSNFVVDFNTGIVNKDKYREYAIIMFKFNKGAGNKYYIGGNYEPLLGGVFQKWTGEGGYIMKYLYGLSMSVTADLKAKCTKFETVNLDINSAKDKQLNKAWTDRVWIGAQKANRSFNVDTNFNLFNFTENGGNLYGVLPGLDNNDADVVDNLVMYYFNKPLDNGYPLTCNQPLSAVNKVAITGPLRFSQSTGTYCNSLLLRTEEQPYKDIVEVYKNNIFSKTGQQALTNLFVKSFGTATRDSSNIYDYDINNSGWDDAPNHSELLPPRIYSLDLDKCSTGGSTCAAGEMNDFTINNVGYNEDSGEKDLIVANGSYTAKAQFFVVADTNKMPIKNIKIDWDDGSTPYNNDIIGFYANRKPYCEVQTHCFDNNDKDTQLTCKSDEDCAGIPGTCKDSGLGRMSFGDSSRACINTYYAVSYSYICTDDNAKSFSEVYNSLTEQEKVAMDAGGYDAKYKYCVYQPKVQIRDNWGWCNTENPNSGDYGCDSPNAWTTYSGKIIITAR